MPVFNDKHLSTSWDEAKWMYDKSRELDFPLFGDSSIPFYYRKPEIRARHRYAHQELGCGRRRRRQKGACSMRWT
ncbi:MAG: hypothetical protein R2724_20210 [Bryobacterales bacterium]